MTPEQLKAHIEREHGQPLDGDGEQLAYVHDAMHSGRAVPGHFHDGDQVRRLWEATRRIDEVDTGGHT